jgi:HAD superfamily hydrolase (TIGR01509 family)
VSIRGAILDIDGTLLYSNDAHANAWVEAFAERGYAIPFDEVRHRIGMGGDKLVPSLLPGLTSKEGLGKEVSKRRKQILFEKFLPHLRPTPGALELVQRLRDDGFHLIVATSAQEDEVEALLKAAGIADLLPERVTSSDAGDTKPAPTPVEIALKKLGLPPDAALMLGDTRYDVESAGRAGVGTIAVRCGGWRDEELSGACAIYDDPADLLEHYVISPLGPSLRAMSGGDPLASESVGG